MFAGAVARGGGTTMEPLLLNKILGTKFKLVAGYRGTAAIRLAMTQGEVQGLCGWGYGSLRSTGKELLEKGKIRILLQIAYRREPEIPKDVPLITDLVPDDKKALLNVYLIPRVVGWNMMLSPGVPQKHVKTLREGFNKTMKDPDYLEEAKEYGWLSGPLQARKSLKCSINSLRMPPLQ